MSYVVLSKDPSGYTQQGGPESAAIVGQTGNMVQMQLEQMNSNINATKEGAEQPFFLISDLMNDDKNASGTVPSGDGPKKAKPNQTLGPVTSGSKASGFQFGAVSTTYYQLDFGMRSGGRVGVGVNWNGVNTGLQVADFIGVGAAVGREIALDYRMSQPLMNRVGMSTNIKAISGLGTASKYLGAAGYGAAGLGTALDINAYNKGQLSGAQLGYNMTGTAVGLGVGYFLGPVAGAVAGGSFWGAQQMYNGYMYWQTQMSIYLTNFENGLKNGWVPGR